MTRMTPRRVGTVALAAALGLGPILAGAGSSAGAASGATTAGRLGQTALVTSTFEDDFNGPANTSPDSATWSPRTMKGLFTHKELATYTDSTANISLDGRGHLRITALRDTSSGTPTYTS